MIGDSPQRQRGRGKGRRQESSYERKFHMVYGHNNTQLIYNAVFVQELSLSSSSSRHRCNQLSWREYSCQSLHK